MVLIYNIALKLYFLCISIVSLFNKKAKLLIDGWRNKNYTRLEKSIWFHFASLGEFEQGRPVLEKMRKKYPEKKIVVTFFSPSGYEIRKNTPLADAVYYLPLDTATNARRFIRAINPEVAIFTKYEYWYHLFNELHKQQIPLYIISGIFRPKQVFFKWYGGLHRKILSFVTHFFVQDEQSVQLLQTIGVSNVTVSGDTRFDRVWTNAQQPKQLPLIEQFVNGQKTFVAGSTWPDDETLLTNLPTAHPDWKFIFVPHEIGEEKINRLLSQLPEGSAIRYSQLAADNHSLLPAHQSLIIDNIGMLSSLYQYGQIAYIGGGFGVGIHNTLEAAAFGLPVIFGPNYSRFKEACDLIDLQCGFSINNDAELQHAVKVLIEDESLYQFTSEKIKGYVRDNTGATDTIMGYIKLRA